MDQATIDDKINERWSHRWLSPKTEVKNSPICATGVFAKEPIQKGEIIRVTGGFVIPKTDVEEYNKILGYVVDNIFLDVSEDFALAPTRKDLEQTATINHSCEPNAGFLDTITIVAIRDIKSGEEICWDYACSQTTFEKFSCNCRTFSCRKTIDPQDWSDKQIQEKYGSYYSPYLKRKAGL